MFTMVDNRSQASFKCRLAETRTNGCLQMKENLFAECSTVMCVCVCVCVCVLSVVNVLNMHKHRSSPSGSTSSQWKKTQRKYTEQTQETRN